MKRNIIWLIACVLSMNANAAELIEQERLSEEEIRLILELNHKHMVITESYVDKHEQDSVLASLESRGLITYVYCADSEAPWCRGVPNEKALFSYSLNEDGLEKYNAFVELAVQHIFETQ